MPSSQITAMTVAVPITLITSTMTTMICLGRNKDLLSQRSKYKSYGALRGCDLGVRGWKVPDRTVRDLVIGRTAGGGTLERLRIEVNTCEL